MLFSASLVVLFFSILIYDTGLLFAPSDFSIDDGYFKARSYVKLKKEKKKRDKARASASPEVSILDADSDANGTCDQALNVTPDEDYPAGRTDNDNWARAESLVFDEMSAKSGLNFERDMSPVGKKNVKFGGVAISNGMQYLISVIKVSDITSFDKIVAERLSLLMRYYENLSTDERSANDIELWIICKAESYNVNNLVSKINRSIRAVGYNSTVRSFAVDFEHMKIANRTPTMGARHQIIDDIYDCPNTG